MTYCVLPPRPFQSAKPAFTRQSFHSEGWERDDVREDLRKTAL
jgi:hypothetical protein